MAAPPETPHVIDIGGAPPAPLAGAPEALPPQAYTWDGPPGLTPRRSGSRRGGYPQRRDWTRIVGASLLLQSEATPPLEARSDLRYVAGILSWCGAFTGLTLAGSASVIGVGPFRTTISRN